jgi:hypothetical protein
MFKGRSLSKVVAVFRQPEAAELAREKVKSAAGLEDGQVRVVGPHDTPWVRQPALPRESVARAALRMQVTSVLTGVALAMAAWLVLYGFGVDVIAATPVPSLVAIALIGTMLGLVVGGALSLGERDGTLERVRQAAQTGRWAVVVQPLSLAQLERALSILQATGAPVARSL